MEQAVNTQKGFSFELVSPAKVEVRSLEQKVVMPASDGDLMVLPGHTRLITDLSHGVLRVIRKDQEAHAIYITGGFADIGPDHCTVLATEAIPVHQLKQSELEQKLEILQTRLDDREEDKTTIETEIIEVNRRLKVLEEKRSL